VAAWFYFINVASADDSESTTNAHILTTLTKSGTYYIAFREKNQDDATFAVSLNKGSAVCDPEEQNCGGGGTGAGDVRGSDRKLTFEGNIYGNRRSMVIGDALFKGHVSFDLEVAGTVERVQVSTPTDNPIAVSVTTHFDHLTNPVQVAGTGSPGGALFVKNVVYHVASTRVEDLTEDALRASFPPSSATARVATIGSDMPGNTFTFTASAKMYLNWSNGYGCGAVKFNNEQLSNGETRTLTLKAPVVITLFRSCLSSRLSATENPYDGRAFLSNLKIGSPWTTLAEPTRHPVRAVSRGKRNWRKKASELYSPAHVFAGPSLCAHWFRLPNSKSTGPAAVR
jgi:hypothetical protein